MNSLGHLDSTVVTRTTAIERGGASTIEMRFGTGYFHNQNHGITRWQRRLFPCLPSKGSSRIILLRWRCRDTHRRLGSFKLKLLRNGDFVLGKAEPRPKETGRLLKAIP